MFAQFYQNIVLKNPKSIFVILIIALLSFGYYSKDFRLDASSETLLIEGDPDLKYLQEIYKEYVGIIRPRVVISGKKEYLNKNSSLIRALLLSGIRAAFLWDYHGGSKWHLMFRRKEILNKCENYFI